MTVELVIHLEAAGGEIVWWAESPGVEGFSAAAPTLVELRRRATRALRDLLGHDVELVENLVGGEVQHTQDGDEVRFVQTDFVPA